MRIHFLLAFALALFWPLLAPAASSPDDCLTVTDVIRGKDCGDPSSVQVKCRNACDQPLDVKTCVERSNGKWDCGVNFAVKPGATSCSGAWVCSGTGKYRVYGRSAGSRLPFPEDGGTLRRAGDKAYSVAVGESQESACKRAQQVASSSSACECEPLDNKGNFRCRVETQVANAEALGKAKPFRDDEFKAAGGADSNGEGPAPDDTRAKGASRDEACRVARQLAESASGECRCMNRAQIWICGVASLRPPQDRMLDHLRAAMIKMLQEDCARNPGLCMARPPARGSIRD